MSEFNFTNRLEIPTELIRIEDISTPRQNQLVVRYLDLSSYDFPDDAQIWLSAQRHYLYQRFDLGTPSAPLIGAPFSLDSFEAAGLGGATLRLMVVNAEDKILASSKPFKFPTYGRKATPLLDMQSRDLGQEVWQLELDEETGPLLLISSRIQDPQTVIDNPMFITCVLPLMLKQIAVWILNTEIDDSPDTVAGKWVRYFSDLGIELPYEAGRSYSDAVSLADEAARLFAVGHELLNTYIQHAEGPR